MTIECIGLFHSLFQCAKFQLHHLGFLPRAQLLPILSPRAELLCLWQHLACSESSLAQYLQLRILFQIRKLEEAIFQHRKQKGMMTRQLSGPHFESPCHIAFVFLGSLAVQSFRISRTDFSALHELLCEYLFKLTIRMVKLETRQCDSIRSAIRIAPFFEAMREPSMTAGCETLLSREASGYETALSREALLV